MLGTVITDSSSMEIIALGQLRKNAAWFNVARFGLQLQENSFVKLGGPGIGIISGLDFYRGNRANMQQSKSANVLGSGMVVCRRTRQGRCHGDAGTQWQSSGSRGSDRRLEPIAPRFASC